MKTNVKQLLAIALVVTSCTTGSKITSGGYSDDLYYTPGDARPIVQKPVKEVKQPQKKSTVVMQVEENEQGKVVDNYIIPKSSRKDNNAYYFDEQPAYSDTILEYKNDKEEVTINNYFEGEEMDYSSRIRAFYNPYFYNPFWDPFWDPYYGSAFSFGFGHYGWGGGYFPGGYGMFNPWLGYGYGYGGYGGYGYGFGGYGYDWYYPGYYGWGNYYPGWGYGGGYYADYGGGYLNDGNHFYGKQNHTGKRGESNAVRYGMNTTKSGSLMGSGGLNQNYIGRNPNASSTRLSGGNTINGAVSGRAGIVGTRNGAAIQQRQGVNNVQSNSIGRGATISNYRRSSTTANQGISAPTQVGSSTRSAVSGSNYTPTYNRPRMNTQPSYNTGSTRQYSAPRDVNGSTQSSRYARPQSSGGSYNSAVRSQSSGTSYQRGAASSSPSRATESRTPSSRSYSPRSTESSSPSRSVESSSPSRSYSAPAPSINSGSSGSVGGSSGGGSSTRSSSGGSGRR